MQNYAFKVDVEEIKEKLKLMPTIVNMDSRFQDVEKAMERQLTRIQNEFVMCTEYENLQKSKDAEVAKIYINKTDYKAKEKKMKDKMKDVTDKNKKTIGQVKECIEFLEKIKKDLNSKARNKDLIKVMDDD